MCKHDVFQHMKEEYVTVGLALTFQENGLILLCTAHQCPTALRAPKHGVYIHGARMD